VNSRLRLSVIPIIFLSLFLGAIPAQIQPASAGPPFTTTGVPLFGDTTIYEEDAPDGLDRACGDFSKNPTLLLSYSKVM